MNSPLTIVNHDLTLICRWPSGSRQVTATNLGPPVVKFQRGASERLVGHSVYQALENQLLVPTECWICYHRNLRLSWTQQAIIGLDSLSLAISDQQINQDLERMKATIRISANQTQHLTQQRTPLQHDGNLPAPHHPIDKYNAHMFQYVCACNVYRE